MTFLISCSNRAAPVLAAGFLLLTAFASTIHASPSNTSERERLHIAVFPMENQSGKRVPLDDIRQSLIRQLKKHGVDVLDDAALDQFLAKHRIRYTAGLNSEQAQALEDEVSVNAVLLSSVEIFSEQPPPRIALLARLVSTGAKPMVLWSNSVGMAGDDSPGILGLGLIMDPNVLGEKATGVLIGSLAEYLAGEKDSREGKRKSFRPRSSFRSGVVGMDLLENFVDFVNRTASGDVHTSPVRLAVALRAPSGKPVRVEYGVTGGTAEAGKQYVVQGTSLTFAPGETKKDIEIIIKDDGVNRDDTTFTVSLKNPTGAALGSTSRHTYTIISANPEPAVTFTTASQQVKENAGTATIGVELSAASGKDVVVPFMVSGGTAKTPSNYTITSSPAVIKAGQRSAAILVQVADNGLNEDDKTVVVTMGVPTNATQGKIVQSLMTIINSSPEPAVTFTTASQQVKESAGTAAIGVELSAISGRDVTVPLLVSGTAKTPGNFTMPSGPVVIKAGTKSATVPVQVAVNGLNEDDKTVVVSMGVPTHGVQGKTTTSTVTIVDTDPVPAVSFASASSSGEEKSGPARFEVKLSAPSGKPVWVEYGVKGGTAVLGKDYALPAGVLSFEPGETTKTLAVDIKDHGIYDDDKTLEITLKNPKNAVLGSTAVHTHTIIVSGGPGQIKKAAGTEIKDATKPPIMLAMADTPWEPAIMPGLLAAETGERKAEIPLPSISFLYANSRGDEKMSSVLLPVGLSAPSGKPVRVEYEVTGGTAEAGKQYVVKGTSLTFAPGETVKEIEVTVKDDGVNRDDTTVAVSLKNPAGAVLGGTAMHTYTILDSSPEPAVTFTTASQQVKESAGSAAIGVELSAISGRDVTVPLLVSGTAKTPGNFTMPSGPVVIKAGTKSATVPVQIAANGVNEDDKTVVVSMGVPTHGVQGKTATSTVTIVDTDPVPAVSFVSASSSGEEKSGPARFEVKLSAASGKPVWVEYGVKGGTAVLGKDYALPAGVLSFEPGETTKTLAVDIKDHGIYDDDKTLEITLKNPKNAVLGGSPVHTRTIVHTAPLPAVAFLHAGSRGTEKSGSARLEVQLSAPSGKPVRVEYEVTGGTAEAGKQYVLKGTSLTFAPGETVKEIEVTVKDDGVNRDDTTVAVSLKNPAGAVLGGTAMHTYTILDSSPEPAVTFTTASQQVKESAGTCGHRRRAFGNIRQGRDRAAHGERDSEDTGKLYDAFGPGGDQGRDEERDGPGADCGQRGERGRQDRGGEHGRADTRCAGENGHEHGDHRRHGPRPRGDVCEREFQR